MKLTSMVFIALLLRVTISVAQWTDNQDAHFVIGQANFTTYSSAQGATGLSEPWAVAIDFANSKMYVADNTNNRVLRFSYPISANQPVAERVFGQADFATNGSSCTATTLFGPMGLAVSNGDLWVADQGNSRVLKFSSAYSISSNGPSADVVLGQPDMTISTPATSKSKMNMPTDVFVDGGDRLWVADVNNSRVLRFNNASSKLSGADADGVLGQSNFTAGTGSTTPAGMNYPTCVWVSGTTLWVLDGSNSRVLRFNNVVGISDGASADGVLGQADFTSGSQHTTQSGFKSPKGLCVDGNGRLYVGDRENHRVMIFNNAAALSNGAPADNVLGQSDYTTSPLPQKGLKGFNNPCDIAVDNSNGKLFVADDNDNRVLEFAASGPLPVELTSFSAVVSGNEILLGWITATETNNYGFEVERKVNSNQPSAISWNKVGFVEGSGTSNSPHDYSFIDRTAGGGTYSYRLKQIDRDGKSQYSKIVEAVFSVPRALTLSENYPNPFNPTTVISYQIPVNGYVTLRVYDQLGREVTTLVNEKKEAGSYQERFDGSGLSSGVYLYRLTAGGFVQTHRMLLLK